MKLEPFYDIWVNFDHLFTQLLVISVEHQVSLNLMIQFLEGKNSRNENKIFKCPKNSIFTGCVPSENDINEIISATELEDSNGVIQLNRFLPHVTQLLAEHKYLFDWFLFHSFELKSSALHFFSFFQIDLEWSQHQRKSY